MRLKFEMTASLDPELLISCHNYRFYLDLRILLYYSKNGSKSFRTQILSGRNNHLYIIYYKHRHLEPAEGLKSDNCSN